ncbi:MAG: transglutaminase-like domain-containing protein [Kiritimatiellia bacterium]|jgi:transglutaminase-like putative cysteine protease|nr:transglutaminase-like domain-containing protein [Kiritimatiellia bacterium]MDP6809584.1 transglutaminase-like domain-containing protein [Kiritimatiellia bacterium]MDP7023565.1 transglutaminase-like domain-containing protein [Kiritimatiellia bacterium]
MTLSDTGHATVLVTVACISALLIGCSARPDEAGSAEEPTPHVLTADIEAGIRGHIDARTREGGGYFPLRIKGSDHQLKLVKIHTEYLASLSTGEHFACVDLVDSKGDVYDVDFFMQGDPGGMVVTETIPHKVNGKPFYFWQQNEDKTWGRVPVDEASQKLMGVVVPRDEFEFRYRVFLPEISGQAKLWIPLPTSDAFQDVALKSIDAPGKHRVLDEEKHGNKILYWELGPKDGDRPLDIRYDVARLEKAAYADNSDDSLRYLAPERLVPQNDHFREVALKTVAGKETDLQRARALYDLVIDELKYAKAGEGWGQGDAVFACDARHGNCTDYHAYFIALARAVDIPARFAIGAAIPSSRDDGGVDGYHCWVEFYAEGKWWPVDISEADKYSALATYYFGHHPANRLEFSRGRDLEVKPGPSTGPINFLAYPILEVEGKQVKARIEFSFTRSG